MTIRKGQPWGKTMSLPEDALIASTDSELADHVSESYPAADIFDAAVTLSASEIVFGVLSAEISIERWARQHTHPRNSAMAQESAFPSIWALFASPFQGKRERVTTTACSQRI